MGEPEVSDEGEERVGFLAKTPEEVLLLALYTFKTKKGGEWRPALDQDQVDIAKKILDEDRLRSFVDEIGDYERLEKIGRGEVKIQGFKVRVEKAEGGGRSFYQLEVLEPASVMRVYEDGTIAVKHEGRFWSNPETLKIDEAKSIDESMIGRNNIGPCFHIKNA